MSDYGSKYPRRKHLRDVVERYWSEDAAKPPNLDSSLKKHTTLLNRLRTNILVGPAETLIKEIDGLTLLKYLEEIVGAVVEGVSRGRGDPEAAVDVIVHLHTRLTPDFFPLLLSPLLAILAAAPSAAKDAEREKEDKERLSRQRVVLRIIAELAMVGAWREIAKGIGEVQQVIKSLMSNDPSYANLPLLTTFLKYFHRAYLGGPDEQPELVPKGFQAELNEAFTTYFNTASKTLVKGQIRLLEQDKRNHEAYIKSGEIFEDRQQAYEKMTKAVERLTSGVQSLADLLGLEAPVLPTAATLSKSGLQIVESSSSFQVRDEVTGGIWDDDEERRFYEELVDLKDRVPASLLGVKTAAIDDNREAELRKELEQMKLEETVEAEVEDAAEDEPEPEVEEPEPEEELQSGPAARLTALFAALPEASNREMVDKLAVEFAFLNSKAARKRLVKFLGAVPKQRTDLLPHYSRLIATLNPYMPDVGRGVIDTLDEELRYLQRKRLVRELDGMRLKNVRFYGELAKFKIAPPYTTLHVLKVFLDDFKHNIENIANFLETCGRFLLRYEGTAETAKTMVEMMRRKQNNVHLDQRYHVMLENAFYQCNPPERVAREVVELPPMQSFIQHLLHDVLMKRTLDKVLKYLRKLHWEDPEVYEYILESFTKIWEIKFSNIGFAAALIYDLQRYHADFAVAVVDQVMEDIRVGMEENIFKFNQRRIATIKYLGELYMYRVVSAQVIFDVLWSLISFGHPEGLPVPGRDSPIDAVTDFFRVRLICTLLDTCGTCFDRGSLKRKLDHYLVIFQLYVTCKVEIPLDVDFMLNDTFEAIRPKSTRLKSFAEAAVAVDELLATSTGNDESSEYDSDGADARDAPEAEEEEDEAPPPVTVAGPDGSENEQDEDVVILRDPKHEEVDEEAKDLFDREFAKMLADTTDARRGDLRKAPPPIFDTAVPVVRKRDEPTTTDGKLQFQLLSKRGNRQQMRALDIPLDSSIAVNLQTHQQQSQAERQQLKRLVLQNEARQGQSEMQSLVDDSRGRGVKWRVVPS